MHGATPLLGQLLLLNEATDVECDMEKENDMKRFVQFLERNEKIVLDFGFACATIYPMTMTLGTYDSPSPSSS